jgi:type I restriction enzyme, S subunit
MSSEWQTHTVGEFLTLEYGKPLDKNDRKVDGLYAAYGANGIKARSDKYLCESKSIIIGRKGSAGELTITEDRFWPLDVTYFVKFDAAKYDLTFVYYLLSLLSLPDLATGVKPGINRNRVYELQVKTPSLSEQQRIVAILDQAFADIKKARANAEKNLKNARELFDSYLNQVFSQRGEGWVDHDLKDIVILKSGTTVKKELERTSGDVAYIKVSGMNLLGNEIEITTSTTFLNHGDINANNVLPLGTTIFPKRGGAIATNKKRITAIPLCIDLNTMGVIPMQGVVLPLYVYFYFKTFDLLSISNGTTIPQINNYSFDGLKVSIPDIEVQKTSIKMMTQIQASTDELSLFYETKLKFLDELKKSLLQKAFSGELTKTEGMVA